MRKIVFTLAFPTHDVAVAKRFYVEGLETGLARIGRNCQGDELPFYQNPRARHHETRIEHHRFFFEDCSRNLLEFKHDTYEPAIFGEHGFQAVGDHEAGTAVKVPRGRLPSQARVHQGSSPVRSAWRCTVDPSGSRRSRTGEALS